MGVGVVAVGSAAPGGAPVGAVPWAGGTRWAVGSFIADVVRSVRSGFGLFLVNSLMQFLFITAQWWGAYGLTTDGPVEDFWGTVAVLLLVFPAVWTAMILIAMFVLRPTRRMAGEILSSPIGVTVFVLVALAVVLQYGTDRIVLSYVVGWLGVTLASVTQFQVQDRGPQPWLGITFLAVGYILGSYVSVAAVAEDTEANRALPDNALGWIVAVLNLALACWAARQLWRRHRRFAAD